MVLFSVLSLGAAAGEILHHRLTVALEPAEGRITVTDRLSVPEDGGEVMRFQLAAGLTVQAEGARLGRGLLARDGARTYELRPSPGATEVVLRYAGPIGRGAVHPEHGMPDAVVSADGVYLEGTAGWYPRFGDALMTFELEAHAPAGWEVISQGERVAVPSGVRWLERAPQDDIYLVAGPFSRYADRVGEVTTEVYLLEKDPDLARRYLEALARHLAVYRELLGDYPYAKFAVVENRWQTGYGMPSFTLLGSRVLRLPFILDSSLPHELLHNWWGNGVLVDFRDGNWSEGLTAYLADYVIQEARGRGAEYRRGALQRYENFAAEHQDAPLREFRARHDDASQAIGYGKSLMLFHMLRRDLGDAAFVAALRQFAGHWLHRTASFTDLYAAFAAAAGRDLGADRAQWLERPGAPQLAIADARATQSDAGHRLTVRLTQVQDEAPFRLTVPVAVTLRGAATARVFELRFDGGRDATLDVVLDTEPVRIDVDPAFDAFRRLAPGEVPPALGTLFGAKRQVLVVPGAASAAEQQAWRELGQQWARRYPGVELVSDGAPTELPKDGAVWILGWDNRWVKPNAARFAADRLDGLAGTARVGDSDIGRTGQAVALVAHDAAPVPLGFVGADGPEAIAAMARKLPHYSRFGRLVFDRASGENTFKDERASDGSALTRFLTPDELPRAALPPEPVLAPRAAS
jgi:aminopeptidase N